MAVDGIIMGSGKYSNRPKIYRYNKSTGQYSPSNPEYYTWKTRQLWDRDDSCIIWRNMTGQPMTIDKFSVKTCSCNSGGQSYYSAQGLVSPAAGYGGTYYSYISVTSESSTDKLNSAIFQNSSKVTSYVPNSGYNMNSPGSSSQNTAVFGNPPYDGDQGLKFREFVITDCPIIPPNGLAVLHIGIQSWNSGSTDNNTTIRFILDTNVAQIEIKPKNEGYIWRYSTTDNKWHLVKPYYIIRSNRWINVEDVDKT